MQKNETSMTILALRPGRRETGLAVLEGDELVDWGILGFRERRPALLLDQVEKRLRGLLLRHQPEVVALEQPRKARKNNDSQRAPIWAPREREEGGEVRLQTEEKRKRPEPGLKTAVTQRRG